jgi:PAS domain S-box-containing protein
VVDELEKLVDLSLDMLCIGTMSGRILAVNPAWSLTLGWTEEELRGRKAIELVHPDDRQRTLAETARLADPGTELRDFENRMLHRDGSSRWLTWGVRADGDRLYAVAHDITRRKQLEAAAREAVELFRVAFQDAPIGMAVWSLTDYRPIEVNRAACELLGRPARELLATPPRELIHPDDHGVGRERALAMLRGETQSCVLERRLLRGDGRTMWAKLRLSIARDAAGRPRYGICQVQELRPSGTREHALRATAERYHAVVETMNEGVWMIDAGHRTTFVNERMAAMLGYEVDDMLGRPPSDFTSHEGSATDGRREVTYTRKDGTPVKTLVARRALTGAAGGYAGAVALVTEI